MSSENVKQDGKPYYGPTATMFKSKATYFHTDNFLDWTEILNDIFSCGHLFYIQQMVGQWNQLSPWHISIVHQVTNARQMSR